MDVGGGASLLVDCLLDKGYSDVIVVDVSSTAIGLAQLRLRDRAAEVTWIIADARQVRLPRKVDVWHDRAVFHFLTEAADRQAYLDSVRAALRVGGHLVIATFGPGGPDRCSGLPVERYDAEKLCDCFGPEFGLVQAFQKEHLTPGSAGQEFTYAALRRLR